MKDRPASGGRLVVTGASRGIGRAVVAALVARGARVVAVGRDRRALETVAAIDPARVQPFAADLTDEGARDEVVDRAVGLLGGIDGMVMSAGAVRYAKVGAISEADLQLQVQTNLVAPLLLSQAAAAKMREQGTGGALVHIGSTLAYRPAPATTAYAATKAGLMAVTRGLATELAADHIRVNAVAPGVVDTEMVRVPRLDPGEPEPTGPGRDARVERQLVGLTRLHPLGRLGTPEDIAQAVVYLLDATWTTGTVLVADGGMLVG